MNVETAVKSTQEAERIESPYVGLNPYTVADAGFFFGRDKDTEIITANLVAARLTLLYGASGVGKSSVLQAGVMARLDELAQQEIKTSGSPEYIVVYFKSWRDEPISELLKTTADAIHEALPTIELAPPTTLLESLQKWSEQTDSELLLILDQFEEYFTYHPNDQDAGTFAQEFPRVLKQPNLRVNFLLSFREDALAQLDRFKGYIPNLFKNLLRIKHLDVQAGRDAICKPIAKYNDLRPEGTPAMEIEVDLVEAVLEQVRVGQVVVGETGRGGLPQANGDVRIETPYLQLVLTRLWERERHTGSNVLRLRTLEALGGAKEIVRVHLQTAMNVLTPQQQAIAASVFDRLVTPSGTKIAQTAQDLARYAQVSEGELNVVLGTLASGQNRILRPVAPSPEKPEVARYEVFHDILAPALLDWRRGYVERARVRRRTLIAAGALALGTILALLTLLATNRWFVAVSAEQIAHSRELEANSIVSLDEEPERSILLALESLKIGYSTKGEDALRRALVASLLEGTFRGHTAPIYGVATSPDGRYILSTDEGGGAKIWDRTTGQITADLKGHTGIVWGGEFSPDGKRVVTASADKTAIVWDVATGQPRATLTGHSKPVTWATFSPDGKRIATSSEDYTAIVWDAVSFAKIAVCKGHGNHLTHVAFNSDSTLLLTSSKDGTARIWDANCNGQIQEFKSDARDSNARMFWSAEFNPVAKQVVTAGADGLVRVWDQDSGLQQMAMHHTSVASSATFSRNGQYVLSSSLDRTARVWDAKTGQQVAVLEGHTDFVRDAVFAPDNEHIITGSYDQTARVWDLYGGREGNTLRGHAKIVWSAFFSPDDKRIVTASDDQQVIVWDVTSGQPVSVIHAYTSTVGSAVFSPDGSRILAAGSDGTARVFDAESGNELLVLKHPQGVPAAFYSPDGRYIATASRDHLAYLWNAQTGAQIRTFKGHQDVVYMLAWGPDSKRLATTGYDNSAMVWDIDKQEPLVTVRDCCLLFAVALSPDGRWLATGGDSHLVRIWNAETGAHVLDLRGHTDRIRSIFYSADGKKIVSASVDGTARVWDAKTGELKSTLRGHSDWLSNAVFSHDGNYILTSSNDRTARLYDANIDQLLALAKTRVTRSLSCEERQQYLHEPPCPTPTPNLTP